MYAQTNTNVNVKKFNPKVYSPSVYIPCWLIQVPTKLLSNNAKILYGRLAQWANSSGVVYRSCPQLSQELGAPIRSIERHLKELKNVGLIGTFHPQAGGVNHYEFYEHEWMKVELVEELIYKSDPPSELSVPPVINVGTPPSKVADINIKEIKRNNNKLPSISPLSIFELQISNPCGIPERLITEWVINRKKYPVTRTVWNRVTKVLLQLRERGIDPIEAFERMVASGWQSIEVHYFEQELKGRGNGKGTTSQWDMDAVIRA